MWGLPGFLASLEFSGLRALRLRGLGFKATYKAFQVGVKENIVVLGGVDFESSRCVLLPV